MSFFNLAEFLFIFLGIKARRKSSGGELKFKEGLKTGVAIAAVYAATSCLFFLIELVIMGPEMLAGEAMSPQQPMWQVALAAFAGLSVSAIILGLIYSSIISFLLALTTRRHAT